eukprot:12641534-Ditylum_brightwellii.AAC.1
MKNTSLPYHPCQYEVKYCMEKIIDNFSKQLRGMMQCAIHLLIETIDDISQSFSTLIEDLAAIPITLFDAGIVLNKCVVCIVYAVCIVLEDKHSEKKEEELTRNKQKRNVEQNEVETTFKFETKRHRSALRLSLTATLMKSIVLVTEMEGTLAWQYVHSKARESAAT